MSVRPAIADEAVRTTVLIADDDPAVLRALGRILSRLPVEVITATDGMEALDRLRERRVDILVSDIDMPKLDGLFLMRAARRESPATWRILVTGAATMARTIEAINHGEVVRFFTKPIDPVKLVEEMTALISRVEQQRRGGVHELQSTRRQALHDWIADRFPGAEQVEREADGTVTVDVERARAALAVCGPAARALVGLTKG